MLNYLKYFPESKIHAIFDVYSNEGNKNSLSKYRATLSQDCQIEHLRKNLSRIAEHCLITLLVDILLSVNVNFGKEIYVTKGKRCFQASPNKCNKSSPIKSNDRNAAASSPAEASRVVCKEADEADAYGLVLYILVYCHRKMYSGEGNGSPKDSVTYRVKMALGSPFAEVFVV